MPAHLFNAETQREVMGSRFWPAAGDIDAVLRPHFEELRRKRDALRQIAAGLRDRHGRAAAAPPAPEPPLTDAERERVIARFRVDWAAVRCGRAPVPEPTRPVGVSAKHLTDEQLLARMGAMAAEGGPAACAAVVRAAALGKRLGRE